MPKSQFQQTSFASGELSPLLKGRTDLDQYYQGAEQAEGVVIVPQGGVKRRPGTQFVDVALRGNVRQTAVNPTTSSTGAGANVANLNDGNANTYFTSDANLGTPTGYIVAEYNLGTTYDADFVTIDNASLIRNGTGGAFIKNKTLTLQYKAGGTVWINRAIIPITSEFGIQASEKFDISYLPQLSKREWRLIVDLNAAESVNWRVRMGEWNLSAQPATYDTTSTLKSFSWEYAEDFSFLVVLTENNARFYRAPHAGSNETVYVADIPVPYTSAQIPEVRDAQTENVMLMFHEDQPTRRIIFDEGVYATQPAASFISDQVPYVEIPKYDFNDALSPIPEAAEQRITFAHFADGNQYQIDVEGVLSKNITYNGVGSSSTAFNLQKNLQEMPNFPSSGITVVPHSSSGNLDVYTITFGGDSARPVNLLAGFPTSANADGAATISFIQDAIGATRSEPVWSVDSTGTRGFPKMGVFSDGRLWLGGTKSKPQSLFASRAGEFFNFFTEKGDDDEGIFITIDSRGLTNIVDINPDRGLQVFCAGSEFLVKGVTPATIEVVSQTQHGTFNLEAKSVDGATLFVDKNGNTLRQYLFNFNEDAYTSNDISVLSSQLVNRPLDMAILSGTTTEDANWVFIINKDGTAAVLNTMRNQDINGFTRWTPYNVPSSVKMNLLESCSAVGDELYVVVKRTFASGVARDIERWSFDYLLESSVKTTVTAASPNADVFVPIDQGVRLAGFTVSVVADSDVLADRAVTANGSDYGVTITAAELDGFTTRDLEIGLNFPVKVKTMPLNTNPGTRGGQNAMKRKKITNLNLRVHESAGVYIDGNAVPIRQFGDAQNTPLNTPFTPRTGIIEDDNGGNGWATEVAPEITVPDATPFHLQVIQYEVESS